MFKKILNKSYSIKILRQRFFQILREISLFILYYVNDLPQIFGLIIKV